MYHAHYLTLCVQLSPPMSKWPHTSGHDFVPKHTGAGDPLPCRSIRELVPELMVKRLRPQDSPPHIYDPISSRWRESLKCKFCLHYIKVLSGGRLRMLLTPEYMLSIVTAYITVILRGSPKSSRDIFKRDTWGVKTKRRLRRLITVTRKFWLI